MRDPKLMVKTMIDDVAATGTVPMLPARLQSLLESLERICPACLAATSQETWDLLHQGRPLHGRRS